MRARLSYFKWWRANVKDKVAMKIAWLLPSRVVMWAYVRVGTNATTGEYGNTIVPELSMMDALKRWEV